MTFGLAGWRSVHRVTLARADVLDLDEVLSFFFSCKTFVYELPLNILKSH